MIIIYVENISIFLKMSSAKRKMIPLVVLIVFFFSLNMNVYSNEVDRFEYRNGGPTTSMFRDLVGSGKPVFYFDIVKLFSNKKGHFDLKCFTQIKNDRLFFYKDEETDRYKAKYTIKVAIYSEDSGSDIPIKQEFIDKEVFVDNFSDTENTKIINVNNFSFLLNDGRYRISIISEDNVSNKRYTIEEDVSFFERGGSAVSKLVMIDVENQDKNKINEENIRPLILNIVDKEASFVGAFFQVFSDRDLKKYSVNYKIEDSNGEIIHSSSYDRVTKSRENNEVIDIGFKNIKIGNYDLVVEIKIDNKSFIRKEKFFIRWKDVSIFVDNMRSSISQLTYILDNDSINSVLKKDEEFQKQWFEDFWDKLEKNHGSEKNSLLNEYYRRVVYSNNKFSIPQRDGWRSDRGSVYCIMGEPDEIHSYDFPRRGRPYQVWTYYTKGTQYIFEYYGEDYILRK